VRDIEVRELAPGLLIGIANVRGIGRESGIELNGHAAWLFEMQAGKIARWRAYVDEAAAEQAAEEWTERIAGRT
jgi:ketosteroid isomerase-like protein